MEKEIEKIINRIKKFEEGAAIYLFGSYAKGNQKPLSDIDIAVILKKTNPKIEAEIGSMYSNKIDLILFHRLPLHIKYEVFKYGRPLFIRDKGFLEELKFKVLREYLEVSWIYNRIKNRIKK